MPNKTREMVSYQKKRSKDKKNSVIDALNKMIANGEPISVNKVAVKANVTKQFIYQHEELYNMIKEASDSKSASLSAEESLKQEIESLKIKIKELEIDALGNDYLIGLYAAERNRELTKQIKIFKKYEELKNKGLL